MRLWRDPYLEAGEFRGGGKRNDERDGILPCRGDIFLNREAGVV